MRFFKTSLLMLSFLLSACTSVTDQQQVVNKWQGRSIQTLIDKWGEPDAVIQLLSGNKLYHYIRKSTFSVPNPGSASLRTNNKALFSSYDEAWRTHQTITHYHQISFEVTPDGYITHIVSSKADNNGMMDRVTR